ncbi:ankyrin, partial [Coprinopsis marcescibilis]
AAMEGNLRIVQLLLECPGIDVNSSGKDGRTPLMEASFNGHLQIVQLLLACSGIEVNAVDEEGWTALMFSSLHRDGTSAEVTRLLLESPGIDVSMKNLNGDSALILAANLFWSSLGKLRTLVGFRGIDLDIRDAQGKNVLMTSIGTGRQDMVEML